MFQHEQVIALAIEAGNAILEIYNKGRTIDVLTKDDNSPLTDADLAAHRVIVEGLQRIDPNTPIVSEEGRIGDPLSSDICWLVDPLDGTKEFIKRNGMFTVNIALMSRRGGRWTPVFGVVHAPVTSTTWFGGTGVVAERRAPDSSGPMIVRPSSEPHPTRLVASGSHRCEKDESFAASLGKYDLVRMGSSLKACVVADGSADLYPRFGPTSCWDIAAAHAVVIAAGGLVLDPEGKALDYDLVDEILNPHFLVTADNRWNELWVSSQD
ncbi:MAG: 3'(2'),5'-bisphosphate nucleotidase CysQ [Candidatus Thermoplasmatota archaeon]|nr:3'(2'),5'-bisphosphate nucleotidase CysQ [Candidatus Thermoplasmatota archaeon]